MTETQRAAWPDQLSQRLLKERIVVLGQDVDDEICNRLCGELLLPAAEDPHRDITLYINSPGGSVTAGRCRHEGSALDALRARFAGRHTAVTRVLAEAGERSVLRHEIHDLRPRLRSFASGNAVLLRLLAA